MSKIRIVFKSGLVEFRKMEICCGKLSLPRKDIPLGVDYIDFVNDEFSAGSGSEGFYLVPSIENNGHAALCFFRERSDTESIFESNDMPVFAVRKNGTATLAVVSGMSLDYSLCVGVRDGNYYVYPRFLLNGEPAPEDIEISFLSLHGDDASYSGIARRYRRYQLERGACIPLRKRMEEYPVLKKALKGPMVRIRQAWKPVPSPVPDQTEETEPPIHVAVTFERVGEIIEEFHRQGIENAEFCLVGWNKSGHDGRFPDIFPVEPLLGGEEGLLQVIAKAKKYGYLICAHTNVLDSYKIAKRWREEYMLRDRNGSLHQQGNWGGGNSYFVCPEMAYEKYAVQDMEDMARLGFYGTHYLDVMTILRPDACYHPEHPLSRKEAGEWRGKTLELARKKVGASASEGSWDFCIGSIDYVLYTIFHDNISLPPICDKVIPFWHLVYHGIVLYNSCCDTVNSAIKKDKKLFLRNSEFGGRPLAYFYAKFLSSGTNWMGDDDLICATDEQLRQAVKAIKKECDEYSRLSDLQMEFMEEHEELAPGVYRTVYSSGDTVIVNYTGTVFEYRSREVQPQSYLRF